MSNISLTALTLAAILLGAQTSAVAESAPAVVSDIQDGVSATQGNPTRVLDTRLLTGMDELIDKLADRRVIFVGESHDQYADHLDQLAVIQGLQARGKALAIGMEMFQQPFQTDVDAYIAGRIDEPEFLRRTQYFERWRFDYRLYRPILRFARAQGIPVIALNLASELTAKAGDVGIGGLSESERARIPADIDRGNAAYRKRLETIFAHHPHTDKSDFERFLDVQLLWDEGMAARAARYLAEHPERTLVMLTGGGHVEYGQGIPSRLQRREQVPMAIVLNGQHRSPDPAAADFFLYPEPAALDPAGKLGVMLGGEPFDQGARVDGFDDESGAKRAGIEKGDRILMIGGQPITSYTDIRIALLDTRPGQRLSVKVARPRLLGSDEERSYEVKLR